MPEISITHLLVDLGTVQRLSEVALGHGRFENQYADLSVDINLRIFSASAREQLVAQERRLNVTHIGYVEPDQDVALLDMIVRTEREGVSITPEYYHVIGILDPSLVHHRKLQLERITKAAL